MENYCAFSKNHKCLNWTDYELTRYELEEAGSLCQANWIEIEQKMNTYNYYRHYLTITVSHIQSNNNVLTLKGVWLPPDPHLCPSSLPLIKDPHEEPSTTMLVFIVKPSRKPLNKFGKPSTSLIILFFSDCNGSER